MVASASEFQTKVLRRNFVSDEYELYRAALEWDLTDPIVIETRKGSGGDTFAINPLLPPPDTDDANCVLGHDADHGIASEIDLQLIAAIIDRREIHLAAESIDQVPAVWR
jgi:hypothetical protein